MKKLVCLMLGLLWLASVSAPVFAGQSTMATPTAKTAKHKKTHSHKGSKKRKGLAKAASTPVAK